MSKITIYLPDKLEAALRDQAKKARKSLSSYIADLANGFKKPSKWPKDFPALYGSWVGPFPQIEDPPPEEVEEP